MHTQTHTRTWIKVCAQSIRSAPSHTKEHINERSIHECADTQGHGGLAYPLQENTHTATTRTQQCSQHATAQQRREGWTIAGCRKCYWEVFEEAQYAIAHSQFNVRILFLCSAFLHFYWPEKLEKVSRSQLKWQVSQVWQIASICTIQTMADKTWHQHKTGQRREKNIMLCCSHGISIACLI